MQNKVIPSILCIFSLLVVIQSQITPPDNLQKYYKCWTFAECVSDGPAHQKFENCVSTVSYQELYPGFQYVNRSYFEFHTDSIDAAAEEYCNLQGKEQEYSIVQTLKGLIDFTNNMLCPAPNQQDLCKKYTSLLTCFFNLLDNLMEKNVCTLGN